MQKSALSACRRFACHRKVSTITTTIEKTPLYDFHIGHGAKMVPFAGYLLPVQYADASLIASHLHTRQYASIFDVSHMLQTRVHGADAIACIESICTANIAGLRNGMGTLTLFTNAAGGICDDAIVTRLDSQRLYIVSNAARRHEDRQLIEAACMQWQRNGGDVYAEFGQSTDWALCAVQGPDAVAVVRRCVDSAAQRMAIERLAFMETMVASVAGVAGCQITRCGYTGEDGVEVTMAAERATHVVQSLLDVGATVRMAGLGVRDSLRLEAGLCLYGSDMDESIGPAEAGLGWLVAKRRRAERNFPGADVIVPQLLSGKCERRRVGLRMVDNGPPARNGVKVFGDDGHLEIGHITSGCPSPSLGVNVAMGYVRDAYKRAGTMVQLLVRNKMYAAIVTKMPFVPSKYYTGKAK